MRLARLVLAATLACLAAPMAIASSHREAPFIAGQAQVDGTDLYMFRGYENREAFVTILANFQPFKTHRRPLTFSVHSKWFVRNPYRQQR
jgi:hypothetical protein